MTWCGILKSGEDRVFTIKTSRIKVSIWNSI
jgi:hypothetical protein